MKKTGIARPCLAALIALLAFAFAACPTDDDPPTPNPNPNPEPAEYTVTFDADGGDPEPDQQTVKEGEWVNPPADPSKPDHFFVHWHVEGGNPTSAYDFDAPVNEDLRLKARYRVPEQFEVTFDTDGGEPAPPVNPATVTEGETAPLPEQPTKDGYYFIHWYVVGGSVDVAYDFNAPVSSNFTLRVRWEEIEITYFTITFDADGGSPEPDTLRVVEGELATKPSANTFKAGSAFLYWGAAGAGRFDFNTPIMADITLVAHWEGGRTGFVERETENGIVGETPNTPIVGGGAAGRWNFAFHATAGTTYSINWNENSGNLRVSISGAGINGGEYQRGNQDRRFTATVDGTITVTARRDTGFPNTPYPNFRVWYTIR